MQIELESRSDVAAAVGVDVAGADVADVADADAADVAAAAADAVDVAAAAAEDDAVQIVLSVLVPPRAAVYHWWERIQESHAPALEVAKEVGGR